MTQTFNRNNPKKKEEKLIVELIDDLNNATHIFWEVNKHIKIPLVLVVKDAALAYLANALSLICNKMDDNWKKKILDDAEEIFNGYIKDIREEKGA